MARGVGNLNMADRSEDQMQRAEDQIQRAQEDRILRVWTPVLLRTILIVATVILVIGLFKMITESPGYYVQRYHEIQAGHYHARETLAQEFAGAFRGDPHAITTLGLLVLTLVPLGRVAFCFLFFIKQRDYAYVGFTAYVLIGLLVGVWLGQMG
jgi:uncharacterized membrane protein